MTIIKDFHNDLEWSQSSQTAKLAIDCLKKYLFEKEHVAKVEVKCGIESLDKSEVNPDPSYNNNNNSQRVVRIQLQQKQSFGDLVIYYMDKANPERLDYTLKYPFRTVEVKTRKPNTVSFFRADGKIVIEEISNIERNGYSSALLNSGSFYWLYILTELDKSSNMKLAYAWLFRTIYLQGFFKNNFEKYKTIISPNTWYHTQSRLVPINDIDNCLVWTSVQKPQTPMDLFYP